LDVQEDGNTDLDGWEIIKALMALLAAVGSSRPSANTGVTISEACGETKGITRSIIGDGC
jgi:hypothetical protein